jgi:hypothetical protein
MVTPARDAGLLLNVDKPLIFEEKIDCFKSVSKLIVAMWLKCPPNTKDRNR